MEIKLVKRSYPTANSFGATDPDTKKTVYFTMEVKEYDMGNPIIDNNYGGIVGYVSYWKEIPVERKC